MAMATAASFRGSARGDGGRQQPASAGLPELAPRVERRSVTQRCGEAGG